MNKLQENTQQVISATRITKTLLNEMAVSTSEDISNYGNLMESYIKLKALKNFTDTLLKEMESEIVDESEKYSKIDSTLLGCSFQLTSAPSRYDYSHDEKWTKLKEDIKEREEMLKGANGKTADTDTGEIIKPAIKKEGKYIVKVTIPNE